MEQHKLDQLAALKIAIGDLKHDLSNTLTVLNGKLAKLERTFPAITNDPCTESIKNQLEKVKQSILKLDELRK